MTWTSVSVGIMTWRCLEEGNFFLSASSFNLYYRFFAKHQKIKRSQNPIKPSQNPGKFYFSHSTIEWLRVIIDIPLYVKICPDYKALQDTSG